MFCVYIKCLCCSICRMREEKNYVYRWMTRKEAFVCGNLTSLTGFFQHCSCKSKHIFKAPMFREQAVGVEIPNWVLNVFVLTAYSCVCGCLCLSAAPSPHVFSSSSLKACYIDNPHTQSVNKRVGVTLPVTLFISLHPVARRSIPSISPSFCLCDWLLVSSTYLRTLRPDACGFSRSYCQSGRSHAQIGRYLNEHPTLMPLSVCPPLCKPFSDSWVDL